MRFSRVQQAQRKSLTFVSRIGSGADAEDAIFGAQEQMEELGLQLQHSAEAKFLLRALLEMRFRRDHAQQACAFVFAQNKGVMVGNDHLLTAALDWLCLHVEDRHLPRQFASLSRIEVVSTGSTNSSKISLATLPKRDSVPTVSGSLRQSKSLERRVDPSDGLAYTLEEFIEQYGAQDINCKPQ